MKKIILIGMISTGVLFSGDILANTTIKDVQKRESLKDKLK